MKRTARCWLVALAGAFMLIAATWALYHRRAAARSARVHSISAAASSDPRALLAEADRFAWLLNSKRAAPLYSRAEDLFRAAGDPANALHAHVGFLRATAESGSFPQLSSYLAQQLETPLVQSDPGLRLWCLVAKGNTDIEVNVVAAKQDWEQAETLAKRLGENGWANRASGELGVIRFLRGDSGHAAFLVGEALLSSILHGDVGGEIRYLELFGNGLAALNRNTEALRFLDRATRVASETRDVGFPFMAYEGKAQALVALNRFSEASVILDRALAESRMEGKRGHETQILILMGEMKLRTNDTPGGIRHLEEAAQLGNETGSYRMVAQATFDLARVYLESGDLVKAESRLKAGLDASRQVGDRYFLPQQLQTLADLDAKQGRLAKAGEVYRQAEDLVDGLLVHAPGAYTESSLVGVMSDLYLSHFQLEAARNDVPAAFYVIERARGRTAVGMLRSHSREGGTNSFAAEADRQISILQGKLVQSNDSNERAGLLDKLDDQENELIFVSDSVAPSRYLRITHPLALASAQAGLSPDETILEYVVAEPNSSCIVITREHALLVRLPAGRKSIESAVSRLLDSIRRDRTAIDDERRLYDWLIAPVPAELIKSHLIVVPDGALHLLPFECLTDSRGERLVETLAVSYAPSATAMSDLKELRARSVATIAFLGLGGVPYDPGPVMPRSAPDSVIRAVSRGLFDLTGLQLTDLPASRREVVESAAALGLSNPVLLLGSGATESAFKRQPLGRFKIIHLAVHAFAMPDSPERAALVLGRDPSSSDDGLLQPREIAGLPLNAELVTLSACDTGNGKIQGEEGALSLVQAFLFSGARSVLASLWSVDDSAAAALMTAFYSGLGRGEDEAAALRQAKLTVMSQPGRRSARYWAGFILTGYADAKVK